MAWLTKFLYRAWQTADGTASADSDFVPLDTTITFKPGEERKDVSVKIIDDGKYERDEYFQITLSNATNGASFDGMGGDEGDKAAVAALEARGLLGGIAAHGCARSFSLIQL